MIKKNLLSQSRRVKQLMVLFADAVMGIAAVWVAYSLRLDTLHWPYSAHQWWPYVLAPILAAPIFWRNGLYRAVFRHSGMAAMRALVIAVTLYAVLFFGLLVFMSWPDVPRSLGLLQPLILILLVGGSRAAARQWLSSLSARQRRDTPVSRLLIYGAGSAGVQIANAIATSHEFKLLGFVDDSPALQGLTINNVPVYAPANLPGLVEKDGITDMLLALPSITRVRRNEILNELQPLPVHVRSLPGLTDLAHGRVALADIKDLDVEDLLGRDPVPPDRALLARNLMGKVVLVTGAAGSIGSELCRQILQERPARLILVEHSEFGLYSIHQELEQLCRRIAEHCGATVELAPLLANVRDYGRMLEICRAYQPHTIYHAAAYKHVPLVEHNPAEGIANNVLGTFNTARAAIETGVSHFVLVSTDKAVRPTNVMGASKRLAEMVLQALSAMPALSFGHGSATDNLTRFAMVRFGNVLGSSGSVVPLFRRQIETGGPITLTHADVTRYFMTIPEAAQLVLQAGAMAEGGEVYVLDMGEPVRIIDLARRMVKLSGFTVRDENRPDGDIAIEVTGLRPGEKLYEELLIGDNPVGTPHPRILKAREDFVPWEAFRDDLELLQGAVLANDTATLRTLLLKHVSGFTPDAQDSDLVGMAGA
ncbi:MULTISPECIES: nucleoside-diphosphate sugar epimerase/dehydratase [unclassified Polaromonas]|uniref:polysaccharide biosynthesis protein n=1 Tax=unclassified Polaromonas TaxID=2638319 RepID=UPI000F07C189|nr:MULTISPECIES: nucleoside-diphosphate sugar epimerase/dehydratase [unclassified Polaromonas]AYQ27210.1 polysaccharide biosynthesis protein [Polaromonas sp. SP1]QGJ17949.1 NAD-dependent epimerase/dehydratase family protein [Polaromonas sp. Pch-P]